MRVKFCHSLKREVFKLFHISLRFRLGEGEVHGEVEEDGEGGEKVVQGSV